MIKLKKNEGKDEEEEKVRGLLHPLCSSKSQKVLFLFFIFCIRSHINLCSYEVALTHI